MTLGRELAKLGVEGYDRVKSALVSDFKNGLIDELSSPVISVLIEGDKVLQSKLRTSNDIKRQWQQPQCRIVLNYIHDLDKDVYGDIWSRYLIQHSKSYKVLNNGLYIEFKFKDEESTGTAHYFVGRKYANELSNGGNYYTNRLLSIEPDGIYLNKKRVEVL